MIIYKVVLFFTCIPGERFPLMEENICCYRSEYYKKIIINVRKRNYQFYNTYIDNVCMLIGNILRKITLVCRVCAIFG